MLFKSRFKFRQLNLKKRRRSRWPDPELARALAPLGKKIMLRYWLESARLASLWGIAAATALLALSRLWYFSPFMAAGVGATVTLAVAGLRIYLRPDALTLVGVADLTGLNGSAITAYRLVEKGSGDDWALAAKNEALADCRKMSPALAAGYPVVPRRKSWGGVVILAAMLLAYTFLPNPLASYWTSVRQEREALKLAAEEARKTVEPVKDIQIKGNNVLPAEVRKQMESLPRDIKNSGDRQEAANKLEMARWQLDQARAVVGTTAKKDLERLAAAWEKMSGKEWQGLAGALRKGDPGEIDRAAQALEKALQKAGDGERKEMAAALYSGAGAVSDPALRRALKEAGDAALDAGRQSGDATGTAAAGQGESGLAAAAGQLSAALANAAQTAGAGAALGNASASMAALASGLAGGGASGSMGLASAGSGELSGSGGATAGSGESSAAGSAAGSGSGNGSGTGGDTNNSNGQGSGVGDGGLGSGGSGAGKTGGGLKLIYTPFLPGDGYKSQVSGQVRQGEAGNEVSLESSPTTLGVLRPYQEVYGQYMAEAHESLSRSPLPPEMENLVWRYFSSLGNGTAE